jgi:hypothetical protein
MYNAAHALKKEGNLISLVWVPSQGEFDISRRAKEAARRAAEHGRLPETQHRQAKSTVINNARIKREPRILPEGVGKYSREIDTALPGKHTRTLYDGLKRREASVLAQFRREWHDSTDISIRLEHQNQTYVYAEKRGKRSSTFFSDGMLNEPRCWHRLIRDEATFPTT